VCDTGSWNVSTQGLGVAPVYGSRMEGSGSLGNTSARRLQLKPGLSFAPALIPEMG
jgi:hypothetical protein